MKKFLFSLLTSAAMVYSAIAAQLAWDASPDPTVTGYKMYRSLGTNDFIAIGSGPATTLTFTTTFDTNQVSRFYVTAFNAQNIESVPSNIVTNTPVVPPPVLVYYTFEAENGTLVAPMAMYSDSLASGGKYIQTTGTNDIGTATFTLNIQYAGNYVIWCRRVFLDGGTDSFYVTVDGANEDIYGGVSNVIYSPDWMWDQLNAGNGVTVPRVFTLTAGTHSLMFRGRETGTKLDKFIVTNNLNFDPNVGNVAPNAPTNIRVTSVGP